MIWRPDLLSWQTLSGIKGPEPLYFRDHWLSWGRGNAFRTGEDQHMRLTFMEKRTISRGISGFQWPTITVIGFTPVPQLTQEDWDDCMPPATWEQLDFLQNITDPLTGIVGGFKKTAGVNEYREWALVNYHTADDRLVEVDWEINGKIEALYRRYDASPQEISPNPKPQTEDKPTGSRSRQRRRRPTHSGILEPTSVRPSGHLNGPRLRGHHHLSLIHISEPTRPY